MATKAGPVVFLNKNILKMNFSDAIDRIAEKSSLNQLHVLILKTCHTYAEIIPELTTTEGVFIRFFDICDNIEGKLNPSLKNPKPIKMSRNTRYNRINELIKIGFLNNIQFKIPDFYQKSKLSIYTLEFPDTLPQPNNEESKAGLVRTSEYKKARRNEQIATEQMTFAFISKPLKKMASYTMLANYLNRCIRTTASVTKKTLQTEFQVPNPDGVHGVISVTTSSLDHAEIMLPDDMVLVDYIYSVIKERLQDNSENLIVPIENRFRFDISSICIDLGKSDSGGYRASIEKQIDRICATEFMISGKENAEWVMSFFGFVDKYDKPYSRVDLRLLRRLGVQNDELDEESQSILDKRASARYIDVAIPDFIINQIILALAAKQADIMPMFYRDKRLITENEPGFGWLLNNYLMSMLVKPGKVHGAVELDKFSERWMKTIDNVDDLFKHNIIFLRFLLTPDHLLYVNGLTVNARKQPRLRLLYSKVGKFLIKVVNIRPDLQRLTKIKYEFTAIRLSDAKIQLYEERTKLVVSDIRFAEDESFLQYASI